jgi:NAD(P)H-dependent FMN reductase
MKICIISGSTRDKPESLRIAKLMSENYSSSDVEFTILDLSTKNIPFWHESIWDGNWEFATEWDHISRQLASSDAFIFVVPEWAGMAPPSVKNLFLLCSNYELFHKPSMIVGISSGQGGSYPIAELRMSSYKNTHALWIPDHVVIRDCEKFISFSGIEDKTFLEKRIDYVFSVLLEYAKRTSGLNDFFRSNGGENHLYGM